MTGSVQKIKSYLGGTSIAPGINIKTQQPSCRLSSLSFFSNRHLSTKAPWPFNLLERTPMKKLSMGPQLGMGLMCRSPISAGMLSALIVYRPYAGNHSCCEFRSALLSHVQKTLFSHSGPYNLSISASGMFPEP